MACRNVQSAGSLTLRLLMLSHSHVGCTIATDARPAGANSPSPPWPSSLASLPEPELEPELEPYSPPEDRFAVGISCVARGLGFEPEPYSPLRPRHSMPSGVLRTIMLRSIQHV